MRSSLLISLLICFSLSLSSAVESEKTFLSSFQPFEPILINEAAGCGRLFRMYQLHYNRLPIWNAWIKTEISENDQLKWFHVFNEWNRDATVEFNHGAASTSDGYWLKDGRLLEVRKTMSSAVHHFCNESYILYHSDTLSSFSNCAFSRDTSALLWVFDPDPLTTANAYYGFPYLDSADADLSVLSAERKARTVSLQLDSGLFYLKNSHVLISDLDAPFIPVATSASGTFDFKRSEAGFEDACVYYHLSSAMQRMIDLGFLPANAMIQADPHALNGQDNSLFSQNAGNAYILLGTGGVDDGEDADVVVHEFGHFVSSVISPNSNIGAERRALDEALGDYMASSYSASKSNFRKGDVFTWDGHNEYWKGRRTDTLKFYPADLSSNIYRDGEIWSSALMAIHDELGRNVTDSLVFRSTYNYFPNMGFWDAGLLLLRADSILFGGLHSCVLARHLAMRGLISEGWLHPCFNSTSKEETEDLRFYFSEDILHVQLDLESPAIVQVFDLTGKAILHEEFNGMRYFRNLSHLPSGVYIAELLRSQQTKHIKILIK